MNNEIFNELMSWTMEAVLNPNMEELQNIKQRALQVKEQQLVKFCDRFEDAVNNKQSLNAIFKDLLETNNRNIIKSVNDRRVKHNPPEDLEI